MISQRAFKLFQDAKKEVPAYGDFLKTRKINQDSIINRKDFHKIPITSKKNYLQQYNLKDLVRNGDLNSPLIFCSTSGSTGTPFYFPRNEKLSWQYSWLIQDYLQQASNPGKGPVLVIIAFGMGVWIGGVVTLRAFEIATQRMNYPASILPVGYNKTEVLKALRQLAPQFEQTILVGYPPFVKEIIDDAVMEQIDLQKLRIRLLFAAEAFTETYRNYICKKTKANPLLDTLNIYGTADIGAMAYESPVSILIRRIATKNPLLFKDIFGQIEKTPTLTQYNPRFVDFEEVDNEIILTGDSTIPLIRYAIGDHGGVVKFSKMSRIFKKNGLSLENEIKKAGIKHTIRQYPFVYVYERTDLSVTIHGINIYPEFIKEGLLTPELTSYLTEKFTVLSKFTKSQNQYLEINLELQTGVQLQPHIKNLSKKVIRQKLIEKSSEFAEISKSQKSSSLIKLVFWPAGHEKYFAPGVKQKWVLK